MSTRMLILYLAISLVLGVGVSQIISSNQVSKLNSKLDEQELQIIRLEDQFDTSLVELQSEINDKNMAYQNLLAEKENVAEKLELLQAEYTKQVSNGLAHSANTNGVIKEVDTRDQQILELKNDNTKLTENLLSLQSDRDRIMAALDQAQYNNNSLSQLIDETQREVNNLKEQLAQFPQAEDLPPNNDLKATEVWDQPEFRSLEWTGRDFDMQKKVEEIGRAYYNTHTYILNETDCNDMAVDLWNMLLTQNIKSVIVVGNLDKTGETFGDLAHAWLYVFDSQGKVIYLEATSGEVLYGRLINGSTNTRVLPYREGFIYRQPSDLWKDLKKRW